MEKQKSELYIQKDITPLQQIERAGFTLVELMVAIGLFSILITIAVGGFVRALHTQGQVAALISADNNVSLAIEQMSREMRTGNDFCPIGGTPNSACSCSSILGDTEVCQTIAFTNALGQDVVYSLQNGVLERSVDGGSTYQPITSPDVTIPYFESTIYGAQPGDNWPARITIVLGVRPNEPDLVNNIVHLQTTVSARSIDCDTSGNC